MQRILIRLCVKRGCFKPDADFGSRLYTLSPKNPREASRDAFMYAEEALKDMDNVRVLSALAVFREPGNAEVTVKVSVNNEISDIKVGVEI